MDYRARALSEANRAVDALLDRENLLNEDVRFLLDRAAKAGFMEMGEGRDTGAASNSIVAIAYGVLPLEELIFPEDAADLQACSRAFEKLPAHRKTKDAHEAMFRAHEYVRGRGTRAQSGRG